MKEIFVGLLFTREREAEMLRISKRGLQNCVNQYQFGYLEGMGTPCEIFSALPIGVFPKNCKASHFGESEEQTKFGKILYLPFLNLPLWRDLQQEKELYKRLKKRLTEDPDHFRITVYSLYLPFLRVMKKLKRKFGDRVEYRLIITDLPGKYGNLRSIRTLRGIKDRLSARPIMKYAEEADFYIFLTEAMKDLFPPKPYRVVEGFLPQIAFDYGRERIPGTIFYSGTLHAQFGILNLLKAFETLPESCRLWICGDGNCREAVTEAAKKDFRIRYFGYLPKEKVTELQTECDILVNPRTPEGEYTKYSFPSKTMEYLLSGSKTVMYRLPGVGKEYDRFLYAAEENSPEGLQKALLNALNDRNFYESRWEEQVRWMRENKSAFKQVGTGIDSESDDEN